MTREAKIISLANQKGGVGKTSTTALISMELAKEGYKVLTIDIDSQTNLSDILLQTKYPNDSEIKVDKTLMNCIKDGLPLKDAIVNIQDNLDMIPSAFDIFHYEDWLYSEYPEKYYRSRDLSNRIEPLRQYYDFIFIDTLPSINVMSDNAFMSCDYILMIMQTQQRSFAGVQKFLDYIQHDLIDGLDSPVNVVGILPVLRKKNSTLDDSVVETAKNTYGEDSVFNNMVYNMRRVERMDITGITDDPNSHWDNVTHNTFKRVADELVNRIN